MDWWCGCIYIWYRPSHLISSASCYFLRPKLRVWHELVSKVLNVVLTDANDRFKWNLTENSEFMVRSMYKDLNASWQEANWEHCVESETDIENKSIPLVSPKKKVTLTKDNQLKRRWEGDSKCYFCSEEETMQHLFFDCHVAKFVWNIIYLAFRIKPPTSVMDMLNPWLGCLPHKLWKHSLVGATTMCWAIWLCRNDVVFNWKLPNSYMQVIFRGTHWTRLWSQVTKEEEKNLLRSNCQ